MDEWLRPLLIGKRRLGDVASGSLAAALQQLLGYEAVRHLNRLAPAGRPIQTTKDLPGFWAGSWRDVAKDMRGRYPKHLWPDDPANAAPTLRTKRAS
jgi:HrpA-like RNA helicase